MNIHFTLFFSWTHAQKSEMEIHTSSNDLQEKYKPTFFLCAASCVSTTFSYQNFQVQAVVNWFSRTASLQLTESRVQHRREHMPGLSPKLGRSRERFSLTSGRLDKALEDVYKNKWQGKKKSDLSNAERKETLQKHYAAH